MITGGINGTNLMVKVFWIMGGQKRCGRGQDSHAKNGDNKRSGRNQGSKMREKQKCQSYPEQL